MVKNWSEDERCKQAGGHLLKLSKSVGFTATVGQSSPGMDGEGGCR